MVAIARAINSALLQVLKHLSIAQFQFYKEAFNKKQNNLLNTICLKVVHQFIKFFMVKKKITGIKLKKKIHH